jgi:hypothetical protein
MVYVWIKLILGLFGLENEWSLLPISHDILVTFLILLDINLQNSINTELLIIKESRGGEIHWKNMFLVIYHVTLHQVFLAMCILRNSVMYADASLKV